MWPLIFSVLLFKKILVNQKPYLPGVKIVDIMDKNTALRSLKPVKEILLMIIDYYIFENC